jgi:hypothetical protein
VPEAMSTTSCLTRLLLCQVENVVQLITVYSRVVHRHVRNIQTIIVMRTFGDQIQEVSNDVARANFRVCNAFG